MPAVLTQQNLAAHNRANPYTNLLGNLYLDSDGDSSDKSYNPGDYSSVHPKISSDSEYRSDSDDAIDIEIESNPPEIEDSRLRKCFQLFRIKPVERKRITKEITVKSCCKKLIAIAITGGVLALTAGLYVHYFSNTLPVSLGEDKGYLDQMGFYKKVVSEMDEVSSHNLTAVMKPLWDHIFKR